jgi:hypothetical protein
MVVIHLYVNLQCLSRRKAYEGEETHTEDNPALWDLVTPIAPAVYG